MQGAVPLLRTASSITHQTCSRIPHLRAHIIRRRTRSSVQSYFPSGCSSTISQCREHTSASFRYIQSERESKESQQYREAAQSRSSYRYEDNVEGRSTDFQYQSQAKSSHNATSEQELTNIFEIIQEGHPERILFALVDNPIGANFIAGADDVTFTQALRALDPAYFVEPFQALYNHMTPSLVYSRKQKSMVDRSDSFVTRINEIVSHRKESGHKLTLETHKYLLKCAECVGDGAMADKTMAQIAEDGLTPDLECYNFFLGALNWSHGYNEAARKRFRVTPRILHLRGHKIRQPDLRGYQTSVTGNVTYGIRNVALAKFKELVSRGLKGDEATFTNLMIAMGRESDISGVKSILKSVWNVDVDLLNAYDEEEVESPTYYEEDSPLRPSERLLYAVVHIFGSNNDVGLATSLIDYLSRNYNLQISERVWMALYEWAFVLTLHRSEAQKKQGQGIGQLGSVVFESLFGIITDEPHNVRISIELLAKRARARRDRNALDPMLDDIRECIRLLDESRTELSIQFDNMSFILQKPLEEILRDGFISQEFLNLRRDFLLSTIQTMTQLHLINASIRRMFNDTEWPGAGKRGNWPFLQVPKLVEEFVEFLPNILRYRTPTGWVEIETKNARTTAIEQANDNQLYKIGIFQSLLDHDRHAPLVEGIRRLSALLKERPVIEEEVES